MEDSHNYTPSLLTIEFRKVVSDEFRYIFMIIIYNFLINSITAFGCVANVINIIVFIRQGFSNTMNISLLGLAISDLLSLVVLLWFNLCLNPLFESSGVLMAPPEVQHLTAGVPHLCFVRVTGWITVFITAERCLCITLPLKIKTIITPRRTKVIISFIFTSIMVSFFPEYAIQYIDWKFYPEKNKTLLGAVFISSRNSMQGVVFFVYSLLGASCFILVIIFTILLIVTLKRKSNWRKKANADREGSVTNRDRKTVTMVILLAVIVIICYIPGVVVSMAVFFVPELSIVGRYVNVYFVVWSITFIFQATNSSVNIFLYYTMSTKYRQTFRELFCSDPEKIVNKADITDTSKSNTSTY